MYNIGSKSSSTLPESDIEIVQHFYLIKSNWILNAIQILTFFYTIRRRFEKSQNYLFNVN